ncbi:hypothetical protein AB6O49_30175 [Streptomyces sp. SBR177]
MALARDLPGGPARWWQTALLAVLIAAFAVGGLLLSQAAYRGGLAAPLAVVNIANPAAAAVIGVTLLGETFRAGPWGWLVAAAASLVAARGVVLLTSAVDAAPLPDTPDGERQPEQEPVEPLGLPRARPDGAALPDAPAPVSVRDTIPAPVRDTLTVDIPAPVPAPEPAR